MRLNSLARRYAQALFGAAEDKNISYEILNDLALAEKTFSENEDLVKIINSPVIDSQKKKSVIKDIFGERINSLAVDFYGLVIDKNRECIITSVREEYEKLYNEAKHVRNLVIESVVYLDEEQKQKIKDKMETKYGVKFTVKNVLNSQLIGGVRLIIEDNVIDGSVKNSLAKIEESLIK